MVEIYDRAAVCALFADYFRKTPPSDAGVELGGEPETGVGEEWGLAPSVSGAGDGVAHAKGGSALDKMLPLDEMLPLGSDRRFRYLSEQGFEESDLNAVARLSDEWMSFEGRTRLGELADECAAEGYDVLHLLKAWLYDDTTPQLRPLWNRYRFPDRKLALHFVFCDAYQMAHASHRVAEIDRRMSLEPPIDWSQFADPERIAEDIRLAEAGFEEEVARWPAY